MRNAWLLLAALLLLMPALPARAGDAGHPWNVLIVDKDPQGTNVRESPSGRIVKVIPQAGPHGVRLVNILGQSGGWFKVEAGGTVGWMHGSVLGTCASATEDGDPGLSADTKDTPTGVRVPDGTPLGVLGMHGIWLQVRYVDAGGKRHDGWLPEQAVAMGEGALAQCARAWARK